MDSPSRNMYDTFKDEIWKELGPLDPDWFETLTAQTLTSEGNISDQDELCANQEGNFKAPLDRTAPESQLFSTPKVFRCSRVVSPETGDEQLFTAEQDKETLPWTATQSPCLFQMSKEGSHGAKYGGIQQSEDSFDLLRTPQKSPVNYAKQISESLGAQIHPDISWTSSLNTPPALPSTLILTKRDASPCPLSPSTDKNVVFVRKLFPSLSNTSRVAAASPKNNDVPTAHPGVVSPVAGQKPETHDSPQRSLNQSESVWRPKLPDAIEDGDVRSTVASVLDGTEEVLSIFFTNSSSALRKVKTDRIKRKQIIPTKEHSDSCTNISTTNNVTSSEQGTADQEPDRLSSLTPAKTGDVGISQWSPLSLSEIPSCTADMCVSDNNPAAPVKTNFLSGQPPSDRPCVKITDSGFTKKKRKFVYTVEPSKQQVQREETQSQKMKSSPSIPDSVQDAKQLVKDETDSCSTGKDEMRKQGNPTEEDLPPSVQGKIQDLDISQLSRDFAQDFSQMPNPVTLSKVAEDTHQNGFSPSACLSALKQANQKARQTNVHHSRDGVRNRRSLTNQNNSINEGTISDSGFQSAVADVTSMTASSFVLPSTENNVQTQPWTSSKTDIHKTTSSPSTSKETSDGVLQETDTKLVVKSREALGPGRESVMHIESSIAQLPSSSKGTADNINCIQLKGQVHGSLPEKTSVCLPSAHASGFKTASNKGIQILKANLERAKRLFEETEGDRTNSDRPIRDKHNSHESGKNAMSNSDQPLSLSKSFVDNSCQLTASQKADVTELCTLLEEADSQFEFTQCKTAKLKQHHKGNATSPQKVEKELDPDFLTGIDFDDSFNTDPGKHLAAAVKPDNITDGKTKCETSSITSNSTGLSSSSEVKKEKSSTEDVSSSSKLISEGSSSIMSDENKNLDRTGHTETSKPENRNPLMLGVGFKTAGGNVLRVSKKCLSKARALFADLEEDLLTSEKFRDKPSSKNDARPQQESSGVNQTVLHHKQGGGKMTCSDRQVTGILEDDAMESLQNSKMDVTNCQGGFQMASGKGISISAKAMQAADAFFKDCDVKDTNGNMSVKPKASREPTPQSVSHKKHLQKLKNVQGMKANYSKGPINEVQDVNARPAARQRASVQHNSQIHNFGLKNSLALTNTSSFNANPPPTAKAVSAPSRTASKENGSSAITALSNGGGFCTARGQNVLVSADALKKAECILNDIQTFEGTINLKQRNDTVRTSHLASEVQVLPPKNGGFQTASGKGFTISPAALKKAKSLLNDCEGIEDKINEKPTQFKLPVPGPSARNRGFNAASGRPVAFSSEALQKATALFSDINFIPETASVSHTLESVKTQDRADKREKIHCGFSTAGGAEVHVSQKNVLKAKDLLKEFDDGSVLATAMQESDDFFMDCDIMDSKDGVPVNYMGSTANVNEQSNEEKNLPNLKQDPRVTDFSEKSGSARETKLCSDEVEINEKGIKTMLDSTSAASLDGNPPVIRNPSPSLIESMNDGCSANTELSKGGSFCTASGKKVSVSDDALAKAKSLLSENATFDDTKKNLKRKDDSLPPQSGRFQTASGKGVAISSAALKKAKTLFSEVEGDEDKIFVKPTHSKTPVPGPPPRNHGFLSARGKPVALSSEALQKAKSLFSDICSAANIPAVSHTRSDDKKQDVAENMEKIHCGFSTAGGAKVHISQKNLLKAKNLSKEFDDCPISATAMQESDDFFMDCDMDGQDGASVKIGESVAPMSESVSEKKNTSKSKQAQRVIQTISENPGNGHSKFENVTDCEGDENQENMLLSEIHGKKITLDSTNAASLQGGFCTAGGKKVSVSAEAMAKAKSLLNEKATFEDPNEKLKPKVDSLPSQSGGFQTASGKGVAVSSAALKKAKALLSECEGPEDEILVKPTHSKTPAPGPPLRSHGFLAASGKPVAFSSEGLQKAKALFSDISSSAEVLDGSHTRDSEHKDAGNDTEKIHFGFSTAGGAKVHVSQKSLLKAKNLLKDLGDGERHDSSPHLSVVKDVKRTSHLTTASDKDVPTKESVPQEVKSSSSLQATDHETQNASACGSIFMKDKVPTGAFKVEGRITNLHDSPGEKMSSALDREINQASSSEGTEVKRTEESSVLYFESLNLSGCTETQQKFFAQEALDCTKALLDDENLAEQRLLVASQNVPLQDNPRFNDSAVEERKGKGKRPAEEPDMTGQPPLKRRLLEEFDRTVDGPRGSTLRPEKSSPSGVMKDRRVFKYSVSLHPNITRPHRSGTNYVETRLQKTTPTQHSAPGDSRSAHAKMSTFVPPFLKSTKTESCNNTGLKDNIRAPSAFVPPFKKQRTVVQESFSKPQEEEDKQQHLFVMPSNRNTYVPPTKKTQSTTDVSGNKSKEDAEIVALADTTKDNVIENQNLPVGCKSEESAAEASSMEDTLSKSQDMFQDLHNIELARDMQDMRIRKKKRQNIRPLPGSLFLTKTSGVSRISLRISVNGKPPARYTQKELYSRGVHQHVCEVTSETAESFRFSLKQFVKREAFRDGGGVQLADGGWLIPSNDGTAGKEEFYRALCDSPGVDPKLISEEWVYNHYRWIVWKQASMERSFPETMGSLCLSPEQVLLQLKYRYDVEVDHSRRPALRKIMEKDDTAAKTLVLCVCGVVSRGHSPKRQSDTKTPGCDAKVETPSAVVWLTDGWYAIKAQLDEPLTAMLHKGRLAVGGKLIINGAQLVGSQDACSPLEAPDSLMLKICANSSRPARWDAKLGFHKDPRPFLLPVSSLFSNGGPVGCVDIVILRSYPIQWMERKPDGGVVFRSVRAEEKEARRYNSHKQKAMESLFAKIQAEFEKEEKGNKRPPRRRRTISRQDIASLQDGEELYEAVGDDPAYIQSHLSEQQLETLHAYRRSLMERKQAELQDRYRRALENAEDREGSCPKRDVTPVWRLCIADSVDEPGSVYQLNLWRPPSDLQSLLKEGCRYKVYNLTTSEGKKHSGNTAVQLTGTKKTQFQDLQASQEWLSMHFQPRVSTHFVDLQNPDFQPLCGEVDLTGYVISVIDGQGFSPALYLADGNLNFLKVRCFSSLAQSGLEDVVKPRVLLALSNLQLRGQSTSPTPVVYAGDLTVFSTNPKEVHLQESLSKLRNLIQGQANFWQTAEEKLSNLIKSDGLSSVSSPALQTRTPASTEERRQDTKTSVTSQQPVRAVGSFTPVSRNRPAPNCSTEKDPASLKRRRALDYLSRIPSPPPLSLLGSVASPYIKKTFVPPRRSGTPSTLKTVQTPARKPVNSAVEDEWVNDEELAMIDTQALLVGDLV